MFMPKYCILSWTFIKTRQKIIFNSIHNTNTGTFIIVWHFRHNCSICTMCINTIDGYLLKFRCVLLFAKNLVTDCRCGERECPIRNREESEFVRGVWRGPLRFGSPLLNEYWCGVRDWYRYRVTAGFGWRLCCVEASPMFALRVSSAAWRRHLTSSVGQITDATATAAPPPARAAPTMPTLSGVASLASVQVLSLQVELNGIKQKDCTVQYRRFHRENYY